MRGMPGVGNGPHLEVQLKLFEDFLWSLGKLLYICSPNRENTDIEIWCNGSTTDSGSVSEGSNPSISTIFGEVAQLVRASDS